MNVSSSEGKENKKRRLARSNDKGAIIDAVFAEKLETKEAQHPEKTWPSRFVVFESRRVMPSADLH